MLVKKRLSHTEVGIYTEEDIPEGTLLFSHDDWIEDEKEGWRIMTVEDLDNLTAEEREIFLRYSYDIDFGMIIGTSDWKHARHISNFMNHSCDPNMVYDYNDNIIARRDIAGGEELTIDYGTFIANVDQDFLCSCGSSQCRRRITKDDWKFLAFNYGYKFPTFMHDEIRKLLEMNKTA
ncbi:MAG: SET domain-containing protein-lysine N-methyltransferase [Spirochaetae bacterium HGW-Spirochaetae-1]|jgi:hypothetical protein|nr:MAG: SET domain-containing protein-lysine N-methyltransferase [Spirochaetae bacterium HGW-Spirochaetae-1]